MLGEHPFAVAGRKYLDAVRLAGALPLVVDHAAPDEIAPLLDLADGVLLTGSPSNVDPRHYGEAVHDVALPLDPRRDEWVLPLIPEVLARAMPLLAICRGAQEVNVALGGTLHQAVQEVAGCRDHRADDDTPAAHQYAAAHTVQPVAGGLLAQWLGSAAVEVNSLHGQAVRDLALTLRAEAFAPDGVIEAFSQPSAPGFNLALQWHPEWQAADNDVSRRLFAAFAQALTRYRIARSGAPRP